jgi:hypothetical protein
MTSSGSLTELALDLAWGQWTTLGASGVVRQRGNAIIDPEALILSTALLSERDPRLRDEAIDWCVAFAPGIVSTSRLKNLLSGHESPLVERFFATVNQACSARWPTAKDAVPWPIERSGKSRLPRPEKKPALSRIQLRALFGVSARAEVLLVLLTHQSLRARFVSASELQFVGYSKRNIAFVLDDLERASLVERRDVRNQARYKLIKAPHLAKLAPCVSTALLVRWDLVFPALLAAIEVMERTEQAPPTIRSIELKKLISRLQPTWEAIDASPPQPERGREDDYHSMVSNWLESTLAPPSWR